jgi:hypothetical protein
VVQPVCGAVAFSPGARSGAQQDRLKISRGPPARPAYSGCFSKIRLISELGLEAGHTTVTGVPKPESAPSKKWFVFIPPLAFCQLLNLQPARIQMIPKALLSQKSAVGHKHFV